MRKNIRLPWLNLPFSLQSRPFFPFGKRQKCFPNSLQVLPLVHCTRQGFPTRRKVRRKYWINERSANFFDRKGKNFISELL